MRGQSAAAELVDRNDDFAAIGLEDADRDVIEFGESDLGDASCEECDASAARALRRKSLAEAREEKVGVDARKKRGALLHSEKAQNTRVARESFEAGALGESHEASKTRDAAGIRKQAAIHTIANGARATRTLEIASDLRAGEFNELAVFDAGWAGSFAGAAVEAAVDVSDERFAEFEAALIDESHLADAAAGRVGFVVPEAICGAGVQAEAAVNAAGVVGVVGFVAGGEAAERFGEFALRFFVSDRRKGGHGFSMNPMVSS